MTKRAQIGWNVLLAVALAAGLAWTVRSAHRGWTTPGWSDASRQWVVCQYVRARINPYEIAQRLLRDTFGPATGPDRVRLKEHRIYSISSAQWTPETPGLLPGQPPPEATYPPSTMSMLVPMIGFLPERWLLPVYTTANLVWLALLLGQLARWFQAETRWPRGAAWGTAVALGLLWPPLQYVVKNGQAGIVSILCAWLAVRRCDRAPVAAGFLFLAALIKPSMALLFFIVPLVRGQWTPIWTAFFGGLVLTALPALWLGEWPWVLLAQWMDLCRYVLQGAFTVQEILNALGWENTGRGLAVVLGIWGSALAWCVRYRRARTEALFAFLALANLAWTYHERHDFALLVVLPLGFAAWTLDPQRRVRGAFGLALCAVLGASLADVFYVPDAPWAQAVRWAGRLAIPALWALTALEVRASHAGSAAPSAVDVRRPL